MVEPHSQNAYHQQPQCSDECYQKRQNTQRETREMFLLAAKYCNFIHCQFVKLFDSLLVCCYAPVNSNSATTGRAWLSTNIGFPKN